MLNTIGKLYGRPPMLQEDTKLWWYKLKHHDYDLIAKSFDRWSSNSSYMPTPNDILNIIRSELTHRYIKLDKPKIDIEKSKLAIQKIREKFKWR